MLLFLQTETYPWWSVDLGQQETIIAVIITQCLDDVPGEGVDDENNGGSRSDAPCLPPVLTFCPAKALPTYMFPPVPMTIVLTVPVSIQLSPICCAHSSDQTRD